MCVTLPGVSHFPGQPRPFESIIFVCLCPLSPSHLAEESSSVGTPSICSRHKRTVRKMHDSQHTAVKLQWLTTINDNNAFETLSTVISALALQHAACNLTWQPAGPARGKLHIATLTDHFRQHQWRCGRLRQTGAAVARTLLQERERIAAEAVLCRLAHRAQFSVPLWEGEGCLPCCAFAPACRLPLARGARAGSTSTPASTAAAAVA